MSKTRCGVSGFVALLPVFAGFHLLTLPSTANELADAKVAITADGAMISVEPLDLTVIDREDDERAEAGLPPRFAMPHVVSVTPDTGGIWSDLAGGRQMWRLRISSPEARSINLGFSAYHMPVGGNLVVFASDGTERIRPFTSDDNAAHGELWTPIVRSSEIVVEVIVPGDRRQELQLELSSINIGYRGFGSDPEDAARSGSCNVDVICPEGDDWRLEIGCVGVISTGGSTFCSGFMVNNTAEDLKPYFMTADHCGIGPSTAASLVVYWNFENTTCRPPGSGASGGPGDGSLSQFQSGSFFRSAYGPSDFTLVELDSDPLTEWDVGFCGWDRSGSDTSGAIAIHHPNTDEKRISFEFQPTSTTSYLSDSAPGDGTHVRVEDWDVGTTEGGSSGSPLFDPDHRVIGQLHGGFASCTSQTPDWYGKISVSWTGGGSSSSRLMDWLDPLGTGQMTTDFISEATLCRDAGTVSLDRASYSCSGTVMIKTIDCGLNADPAGIDTVVVTLASDSEPAGESVLLTETNVDSAKFEGTIDLDTVDAPGVLLVAAGETLTATYTDADDGEGGINIVLTANAGVDCTAPGITFVESLDVEPRSATIHLDTDEVSRGIVHHGLDCSSLNTTTEGTEYDTRVFVGLTGLLKDTLHFYAVEAEDVAGNRSYDDNGGSCYSFTTPDVPDFFTEEFASDNDLSNMSVTFTPNGSFDYYATCAESIAALPTNPSGGNTVSLGDDDFASISVSAGETVGLYGVDHSSYYIGSNGFLTFGAGDDDYTESLSEHFSLPRIAPLFDDFNPSAGGTVSYKQLADRVAVTWQNVPEYNTSNSNTFQVEMFFDGRIRLNYLAMAATDGIAGLSDGSGLSPDFLENDLSSGTACQLSPPVAAPAPDNTPKNRYISFTADTDLSVAVQVELVAGPGTTGVLGWLAAPDAEGVSRVVDGPEFRVWSEPVVHAADCEIVPVATYELRLSTDGVEFSAPLTVSTIDEPTPQLWGDCVGSFDGLSWDGPNGIVNFNDIDVAVKVFQQSLTAPHFSWVDLHPEEPNLIANFSDISMVIIGFQGDPYLFSVPSDCP